MIRRFILSHLAYWSARIAEEARLSTLLQGVPIGRHAEHFAARARRRRDRWKRLAFVLLAETESADSGTPDRMICSPAEEATAEE